MTASLRQNPESSFPRKSRARHHLVAPAEIETLFDNAFQQPQAGQAGSAFNGVVVFDLGTDFKTLGPRLRGDDGMRATP